MDLSFRTNQNFQLSFNVALWKPIFPLAACTFHIHIRTSAENPTIIYRWSSNIGDGWGNGMIAYMDDQGLMFITAPYEDMLLIPPGNYFWDLELIFGTVYKVLTGGGISIIRGITRQ